MDTASVNRAIRAHLQYRNAYVVFITADADEMKQRLVSGTPTPIT